MKQKRRNWKRILRFLQAGRATGAPSAHQEEVILEIAGRGSMRTDAALLQEMLTQGLISSEGHGFSLTEPGKCWLKRQGREVDEFACQHGDRRRIASKEGKNWLEVNLAESPLAALARMKDKTGRRYLRLREVRAGERLRADFTFGQLSPRSGVNLMSSGGGSQFLAADLTDHAIAARQRVNAALKAVGPELADILVDVCCFLKGLGQVETERGWPVRSAKLMLCTALAALARHYEPDPPTARQGEAIRHWGAPDYRPRIVSREDS